MPAAWSRYACYQGCREFLLLYRTNVPYGNLESQVTFHDVTLSA